MVVEGYGGDWVCAAAEESQSRGRADGASLFGSTIKDCLAVGRSDPSVDRLYYIIIGIYLSIVRKWNPV